MLGIGFLELVLVALLAVIVIGPKELPRAIRTGSKYWREIKAHLHRLQAEAEKELGIKEDIDNLKKHVSLAEEQLLLEETLEKTQQANEAVNNLLQEALEARRRQQPSSSPIADAIPTTEKKS